jgi:hypothetical protein
MGSLPFQRLRRIKQLATTHLVYPGAVHTRFEHSLGVMHLATQVFDTLTAKHWDRFEGLLGLRHREELHRIRRLLRLAALLHDVGHAPFSHGSEELLPGGHETATVRIIEGTEIRDIIEDRHYAKGIRVADVIPVAVGRATATRLPNAIQQFLSQILTGPLGVDRMDYLLRDSLHAGVRYGQFDVHRLVNTLTIIRHPETENPVIALERGGLHAAEGLLLARYFMFQQVYYHRVRRIYDWHLKRFLLELLQGKPFPVDEPDEYLRWDDVRVEYCLYHCPRSRSFAGARPFVGRRHLKVAFEAPGGRVEDYIDRAENLKVALLEEFGDGVHCDAMYRPLATGESELSLPVIAPDGTLSSWEAESKLFNTLPPLGFLRVYSTDEPGLREEVNRFCHAFFGG